MKNKKNISIVEKLQAYGVYIYVCKIYIDPNVVLFRVSPNQTRNNILIFRALFLFNFIYP